MQADKIVFPHNTEEKKQKYFVPYLTLFIYQTKMLWIYVAQEFF